MSFFSNVKKIWLTYGLALGLLAAALLWFSYTTIHLDLQVETNRRQIAKAEQEAIQQERISYALWRMDWMLTPLVAQEAARNHWMYEALIPTSGNLSWLKPEIERQQRLERAQEQTQLGDSPLQSPTSDELAVGQTPESELSLQQSQDQTQSPDPQQVTSPLVMQSSPFVKLHFQIAPNRGFSSPQVPQDQALRMACSQGLISELELNQNKQRLAEIANEFDFDSLLEACSNESIPNVVGTDLVWSQEPQIENLPSEEKQQTGQAYPQGELIDSRMKDKALANSEKQMTKGGPAGKGSKLTDYGSRAATANQLAYNQRAMNVNVSQTADSSSQQTVEGVMRAIWYRNRLLLARRVQQENQILIQGCWLDWDAIKKTLLEEISDIVPDADLVPRIDDANIETSRALATLPVDLRLASPARPPTLTSAKQNLAQGALVAENSADASDSSGFAERMPAADRTPRGSEQPALSRASYRSIAMAWAGFLLAALSTAWLIAGVIQLSERRSAFASAVTHELRTPLTTFRLYSEMLDGDMVSSPEQRQVYTKGLVAEADRLSRLVDNVLQFSRLERKQVSVRKVSVPALSLIHDVVERCRSRMASANLQCELEIAPELTKLVVNTSADTVEQILFNLIDNACKYAAAGPADKIRLEASRVNDWLIIRIRDFGPGIDRRMVSRLFRPFARSSDETAGTAAGVGLGLSLSRQLAKQIGGQLTYQASDPGCLFELKLPLKT